MKGNISNRLESPQMKRKREHSRKSTIDVDKFFLSTFLSEKEKNALMRKL